MSPPPPNNALLSINPATGEVGREYAPFSPALVASALEQADATFATWRKTPFEYRSALMLRLAEALEAEKQTLARLMTVEMGKTLRSAVQEIQKCASGCRYFAENAPRLLQPEDHSSSNLNASVRYDPLGPVLAVMPWNFPFWQVFRFAAPSLMAGNVGLLKHASNVPGCALAIESLFQRAEFPPGAFQTLLVGSAAVPSIIADPRVAAVTLTGSVNAGRSVAALAGQHLKKSVLELGGSDPFIVMPSAHLEKAVETGIHARIINNGQSCIAAKRFIVHQQIASRFQESFIRGMTALRVGDPLHADVDLGPLATAEVRDSLAKQVEQTIAAGAELLLGGKPLPGKGYFFAPTVLTDIPPGSPAQADELFGPVASLFVVGDAEEAVRVANDTPFGLGAAAWTNNPAERDFFVRELNSGQVFINGMVASDPRLPFGGVKHSGYGRELSRAGLLEFVNTKTVVFKEVPAPTETE